MRWVCRASRSPPHHSLEADSPSQPVESPGERVVEGRRAANARLQMERIHRQRSLRTVRLEVRSADDPVAPEEGKDVVPVAALGSSLVDLDDMVEAEDAKHEAAVPEQVVER